MKPALDRKNAGLMSSRWKRDDRGDDPDDDRHEMVDHPRGGVDPLPPALLDRLAGHVADPCEPCPPETDGLTREFGEPHASLRDVADAAPDEDARCAGRDDRNECDHDQDERPGECWPEEPGDDGVDHAVQCGTEIGNITIL